MSQQGKFRGEQKGGTNVGHIDLATATPNTNATADGAGRRALVSGVEATLHTAAETATVAAGGTDESGLSLSVLL